MVRLASSCNQSCVIWQKQQLIPAIFPLTTFLRLPVMNEERKGWSTTRCAWQNVNSQPRDTHSLFLCLAMPHCGYELLANHSVLEAKNNHKCWQSDLRNTQSNRYHFCKNMLLLHYLKSNFQVLMHGFSNPVSLHKTKTAVSVDLAIPFGPGSDNWLIFAECVQHE